MTCRYRNTNIYVLLKRALKGERKGQCLSWCLRAFCIVALNNKLVEFVIFRIEIMSVDRIITLLGSWTTQNGKQRSDEMRVPS